MSKIPILIDSDANNELDDQHAIAYAAFSGNEFDLLGVTVNNTPNGDGIEGQYQEAHRVLQLCGVADQVPLHRGADANFEEIVPTIDGDGFDGRDAVEFIRLCANQVKGERLVIVAIGKLTNVALALAKHPDLADLIRLVWLGSNYPDSGEYNLWSDPPSVQYVIDSNVEFEMVTVRYQTDTGSTAVRADGSKIKEMMGGRGPRVEPVEGRHGGMFTGFGDYSVSLFEHVNFSSRPLFDVVAIAVVKNPEWGQFSQIDAPTLEGIEWVANEGNDRKIGIWEKFDRNAILDDFYDRMNHPHLVT